MTACSVDICDRPLSSRGLCHAHAQRLVRYGNLRPEVPLRPQPRHASPAERAQLLEDAKVRYPSLNFGAGEWVAAFGARPGLFEGILDDLARRVRTLIDKGDLLLDANGHEVHRKDTA